MMIPRLGESPENMMRDRGSTSRLSLLLLSRQLILGTPGNPRVRILMAGILIIFHPVESDVMLAAGSLVSPGKRLESGWLYRGRPARPVRELTEQEVRFLPYVAGNYVKLKDDYLNP